MSNILKNFLLVAGFLFLSACGALNASPNQEAGKDWLQTPPADNALYFYGVGYGETLDEAKNDALSGISSKISVSVASTFNSSVTATRIGDDEDVLKSTKNEVVAKSKEIEYTNVKVLKTKKVGDEYAVLVEVSRDDLSRSYKRKLDKIDDKIKTEWELFQKASPFEKLKIANTIERYLKKTDAIFPLLHTLDESFDDSKYTNRYKTYTKEIRKAKNDMRIKIISDENSESLVSLLKERLSDEGVKLSNRNYNVLLKITTKAKKRKYRSSNVKFANVVFALRKTTIKAYDADGNVISNVVYKTKEGSTEGFEDAIAKTAKYEKKIAQMGVFNFITGNKE